MTHEKLCTIVFTLLVGLAGCTNPENQSKNEFNGPGPNIIYLLADDLGYGDLSCYGQTRFSTPHIDQLAVSGIKFTRHYSGSTVCAPSRSSLLSGLHTGHTFIRGNFEMEPEGQAPLPAGTVTIPEILQEQGYTTGAFGKWGLGYPGSEGDPLKQGFDTFFGYNCQRQAHRYYPEHLWNNSEKYYLEGNDLSNTQTYAPDVIHEKVLSFIDKNSDNPFFLYYPLVQPHAELMVPKDSVFSRLLGKYPEVPYVGREGADYGPDMNIVKYSSQEYPHATFAAMVERVDRYVGDIMKKLDEKGLTGNTIVMFSSDNGPHKEGGADPEFFNSNGMLRGVKRDLYEGGIRVPLIVSWPGVIPGKSTTDHVSAFWDLMPTLAEISGASAPEETDGISFLPLLLGADNQQQHEYLYWEFHEGGGKQAILKEGWKAIRLDVKNHPGKVPALYNLDVDPGEQNNVAAEYPEVVKTLAELMSGARTSSEQFNFGMNTLSGE